MKMERSKDVKFADSRSFISSCLYNFTASAAGYTLIEILVTLSIIGLLSTIGTVSYQSARASSRDVKRVSDTKQIQSSLEFYFENNSSYPFDGYPGSEGEILGLPGTLRLSDAGFSSIIEGVEYMGLVPANPLPNGTPYVYRSLYRDGRDCDEPKCEAYAVLFTLEKPAGSLLAGPHALTPTGTAGAEGGFAGAGVQGAGGSIIGLEGTQAALARLAEGAAGTVVDFVNDPRVEVVTETAVAPTAAVTAVANTALATQAATGGAAAGQYFLFFLTQPLLLIRRRRRKSWGTVYNSLSRLPEDLVIVRLFNAATGRVIKSEVTDKNGRFAFLVTAGKYRLQAVKGKFEFPSQVTAGRKEDGQYPDIYHGEIVEVGAEGAVLTPNIPIDPPAQSGSDADILKRDHWRHWQRNLAAAGPVLGAASLVIKPSILTAALFIMQILAFMFFRRFATTPSPKNWGQVYEENSGRPVTDAILRIFALPYHKMLDSRVSDSRGRYNFRVGNSKYYLTVTKPGYLKTESDPVDFSQVTEPMIIAADVPLRRAGETPAASAAEPAPPRPQPPAPSAPVERPPGSPAAGTSFAKDVPPPAADKTS